MKSLLLGMLRGEEAGSRGAGVRMCICTYTTWYLVLHKLQESKSLGDKVKYTRACMGLRSLAVKLSSSAIQGFGGHKSNRIGLEAGI